MIRRLKELPSYRELIRNLIIRDLKVRYKNSVLGVLWSLLNPLLMTLVFTFVFTVMIPQRIDKFPVFFMCGFLPWSFFSSAVTDGTRSIVRNASLIKKVYFPREILPLVDVLSNLVNFLLALIVLFAMLLVFRVKLTPALLMLPFIILAQVMFLVGMALLLSTANVFYRDTQHIMVLSNADLLPHYELAEKCTDTGSHHRCPAVGAPSESDGFTGRLVPGCALPGRSDGMGFLSQDRGDLSGRTRHWLPGVLPL
jgi:ABC-type polysaccharide/polyol phosphate export permease